MSKFYFSSFTQTAWWALHSVLQQIFNVSVTICTNLLLVMSPTLYTLSYVAPFFLSRRHKMHISQPLMIFPSFTDNVVAEACDFCICLGRRHQWRHSAAVTAAGKLVISNLVYLSPL